MTPAAVSICIAIIVDCPTKETAGLVLWLNLVQEVVLLKLGSRSSLVIYLDSRVVSHGCLYNVRTAPLIILDT